MFTESFVISCQVIFTFLSDRGRHRRAFGHCGYYVVMTRFYTNAQNIFFSCVLIAFLSLLWLWLILSFQEMVSCSFVVVYQVVPLSLRLGAPLWVQSEGKSWRGLKDCRSFSFRELEPNKNKNFSFLPYCYIGPIERKQ